LEEASVPCGPINTLDRVFSDPQVTARGAVENVTRSDGAQLRLAVNPMRMSATPPVTRIAPPALGEHSEQVLRELLGATSGDLETWRESGVI
jgi:formyl-CoA transferase